MKVTVCQMGDSRDEFAKDWRRLVRHVRQNRSDLVLLPEMAFYPWFAAERTVDLDIWYAAEKVHTEWISRLDELAPAWVCGSRPVTREKKRLNEGFVWQKGTGYRAVHWKRYLPDEEGYWEASWYERGDGRFQSSEADNTRLGFAICTDIWFFRHLRDYGKQGAHVVLCPRATPRSTLDKWLAGGRAASVVSGAYCLSSNKHSKRKDAADLGGLGWIIDPDGNVLGTTSGKQPFLTRTIDLEKADRAKRTYPRYVKD